MEIILGLIIAMLTWALLFFIMYFIASLYIFIRQEIIHTMHNLKRELKQGMWDLEWQWKLMKGK
jgi:hypothetical protein